MSEFKNLIYNRFSEKPFPVYCFRDRIVPAATIWVGIRAWCKYFRELGLKSGDRIILSYPESPAFLHILFASIWEELSLVILKSEPLDDSMIQVLDARLVITSDHLSFSIQPDDMGMPPVTVKLRDQIGRCYQQIRFILKTSGTTTNAKFICLTEDNVLNVLQSHKIVFKNTDDFALSVLPWSHSFGLVLDLLLCTFNAECIFRDSENGRNLDSLLTIFENQRITHFSGVPLLFERLIQKDNGLEYLKQLSSGIIGGATISNVIADHLTNSNLRVGYGQTEASPGICLGEEGVFLTNYIGKPLGCEIKISNEGELLFKGDNSFLGYWKNGNLDPIAKDTWIPTGDRVKEIADKIYFMGRLDFEFKMPNGIMIQPERIEEDLKEKMKMISKCIIFFNEKLNIFFSTTSSIQNSYVIDKIRENIHPSLKLTNLYIQSIPTSEWIFSPKGGVDRKTMIEKLNRIISS